MPVRRLFSPTLALLLSLSLFLNSVAVARTPRPFSLSAAPIPQQSTHFAIPGFNPGSAAKTVLHIQDVHQHAEAQSDIGRVLKELIARQQIDLIAVEGAFAPVDLQAILRYPDQSTIGAVADYLFEQKKISGALHGYLAMGAEQKSRLPPIVGVDDRRHYLANVDAYRVSRPHHEQNQKRLVDPKCVELAAGRT